MGQLIIIGKRDGVDRVVEYVLGVERVDGVVHKATYNGKPTLYTVCDLHVAFRDSDGELMAALLLLTTKQRPEPTLPVEDDITW